MSVRRNINRLFWSFYRKRTHTWFDSRNTACCIAFERYSIALTSVAARATSTFLDNNFLAPGQSLKGSGAHTSSGLFHSVWNSALIYINLWEPSRDFIHQRRFSIQCSFVTEPASTRPFLHPTPVVTSIIMIDSIYNPEVKPAPTKSLRSHCVIYYCI